MERVGRELIPGLVALNNLVDLIEAALREAQASRITKGKPGNSQGYSFCAPGQQPEQYWCLLEYKRPEELCLQVTSWTIRGSPDVNLYPGHKCPSGPKQWQYCLDLTAQGLAFFDQSKEGQVGAIRDFVLAGIEASNSVRDRLNEQGALYRSDQNPCG